jgi:hypothetical protein
MSRAALHTTRTVRTVAATVATVAAVAGLVSVAVVPTDTPREGGQAAPTVDDGRARPSLREKVGRLRKRVDKLSRAPAVYVRERLHRANAAFNAPKTVQLNDTKVIELVLSDDESVRELKRRLAAEDPQVGARLRASAVMEATLTGAAFKIEEITPTQQTLTEGVTRWKWEFEPTKTGKRRLHLTVTALVAINGKDRRQAVRTFERILEVESVPVSAPTKVAGWFTDNWQWIITTLLIPVGAWAIRRRRTQATTRPAGFEPATSRSGGERSIH